MLERAATHTITWIIWKGGFKVISRFTALLLPFIKNQFHPQTHIRTPFGGNGTQLNPIPSLQMLHSNQRFGNWNRYCIKSKALLRQTTINRVNQLPYSKSITLCPIRSSLARRSARFSSADFCRYLPLQLRQYVCKFDLVGSAPPSPKTILIAGVILLESCVSMYQWQKKHSSNHQLPPEKSHLLLIRVHSKEKAINDRE